MESGAIHAVNELLLTGAVLILVGVITAKLAGVIKVPDVVLFLLAGILIGPSVLKIVDLPAESLANQLILTFGSALILFEGGMSVDLKILRGVWKTIVLLATVGVVITAVVTGYAAQALLGIPFAAALLLGSVIAATDPATLVPVFKQIKIKERVSQTVLSESAFNDATGAILTFGLLGVVSTGSFSAGKSLIEFLGMACWGLLAGAAVGFAVAFVTSHSRLWFLRQYSAVMSLAAVLSAYLLAVSLGGSGYMAVFVAGIILGNLEYFKLVLHEHYAAERRIFLENSALIIRMFIFILLGTHVDFQVIGHYWLAGLGIVAVFMLVARPLTILSSTLPDRTARWKRNEILFMFWVRETGVIPAALSGILVGMGVPYADVIASITFLAILTTLLLQASTTRAVARRLGLLLK